MTAAVKVDDISFLVVDANQGWNTVVPARIEEVEAILSKNL